MFIDPTHYLSKEQLAALRRITPLRSVGAVLWTWAWIAACFVLYASYPTVWAVALVWFVMSGRHLALAILMHEGAHGLLLRDKTWNDRIGQWLTAYPVMLDMQVYRRLHFEHHKHTWTERDPDLGLATALPVTPASFRRKIMRDLTGRTAYARHRVLLRFAAGLAPFGTGREGKSVPQLVRTFAANQRGFLITNALLLGAASALSHPEAYLWVFWLPALTGYSVVLRIRSIAEHACVPDPGDPLRQTRTTLAPAWLRFFVAPHNVNYHLEHHLFMTVPQSNLPKAHALLEANGVLERAEVAGSYLQVLRRATSKPMDASAA